VLNSVIEAARSAAWNAPKLALVAGLIGVLAAAASFFLTLAAFIWAEGEFGALAAATGLGVFFLALALVLVTVVWFQRRPGSSRTERQAVQKAEGDRASRAERGQRPKR
jgi:membrane protein implicated in regulation of membrane protease activity